MIKRYRVGGFVRDTILGLKSKDIDYAVEAPSYAAMRQYVIDIGGEIKVEKEEFLTIRAIIEGEGGVDFVLCRKDGTYKEDGRRPDFVEIGTIYDDLARRDFTMNAIAIDEDGNYLDPHGGREDIAKKLIRCVGEPKDRFTEDSLRLLRAVRFHITKGFYLDYKIEGIIHEKSAYVDMLDNVSAERIADELKRCFEYSTPATLDFLNRNLYLQKKLFSRLKNAQIILVPKLEFSK